MSMKKISDELTVVIPHHDQRARLKDILDDLSGLKHIIIVKGGSFAENCNNGARLAKTKYILLLNDDTRISEPKELFTDMIKCLKKYQIVGCRVDGKDQVNGVIIKNKKLVPVLNNRDKIDLPAGHCLMMETKTYRKLNGYDESFKNGSEDLDMFMRAKKMGMKLGASAKSMIHIQCASAGRFDHINQNVILYNKRWGKIAKDQHFDRIREWARQAKKASALINVQPEEKTEWETI